MSCKNLPGMADHYRKAVELLEELDVLDVDLEKAYDQPATPQVMAKRARIHHRIGQAMKRAEIHAALAQVQVEWDRSARF